MEVRVDREQFPAVVNKKEDPHIIKIKVEEIHAEWKIKETLVSPDVPSPTSVSPRKPARLSKIPVSKGKGEFSPKLQAVRFDGKLDDNRGMGGNKREHFRALGKGFSLLLKKN